VALALLVCSSYSYSNPDLAPQYGTTSNAAQFGLDWVMSNVLPQQAGLVVNQVTYRYEVVKNQEDYLLVHVQNENARGAGYIFRETDDWTGLPGNTISKVVPIVDGIDISYWGRGSIEPEGFGTVQNPEVYYTYVYDPCFDPQTNPECPGYIDPFVVELTEVEVIDPLEDDLIQDELDRKANLRQQKEDEKEEARKKALEQVEEIDELLEQILGISEQSEFSMEQILMHQQMIVSLPMSYQRALVGGEYPEGVVLKDAKLPNNTRGLRVGMAQELLHQEMIMLQYAK
jgi:hypothetical protein